MSRTALFTFVLVFAACDASPVSVSSASHQAVISHQASEPVDLLFQPLDWAPGDQMRVVANDVALESTEVGGRHEVILRSRERSVLSVAGLANGRPVNEPEIDEAPFVNAGDTAEGPTSIHRRTVCHQGICEEYVEYDYDLTVDGSTEWTDPAGEVVTIDRLRFVLEAAETGGRTQIVIDTPEPLDRVE